VPTVEENAAVVRVAYDAFHRGEEEAFLAVIDPDVEWCVDAAIPGAVQVYRGHEGIRRYLQQAREAFDEIRFDIEDFIDAGENRVILVATVNVRGKASGAEASLRGYELLTIRDAKLARREVFFDRAEALAAAGL
jgi:ketosteroid isomerase-like protein